MFKKLWNTVFSYKIFKIIALSKQLILYDLIKKSCLNCETMANKVDKNKHYFL